jgi:glyoxalase family protein
MLPGLHHVTAIAGDPQKNLDFYTGVLGLSLVKRTVNFDDPGSYHFYYGGHSGSGSGEPGTLLTFFAWPTAPQGRTGAGQTTAVAFEIPRGSIEHWREKLHNAGVDAQKAQQRFGDDVLSFHDPDGLNLELVASGNYGDSSIGRLHSVSLCSSHTDRTAALLSKTLDFPAVAEDPQRTRHEAGDTFLDLLCDPTPGHRKTGKGSIHHVAWRIPDAAQQLACRERIMAAGPRVSLVKNRVYFQSIYFREPGGVLFEIATDGPGFAVDEPADQLGSSLRLPPWLESIRSSIEQRLPAVSHNPNPNLETAWTTRAR